MRVRRRRGRRVKRDLPKVSETLATVADTVKELHRMDAERREEESKKWTPEK